MESVYTELFKGKSCCSNCKHGTDLYGTGRAFACSSASPKMAADCGDNIRRNMGPWEGRDCPAFEHEN